MKKWYFKNLYIAIAAMGIFHLLPPVAHALTIRVPSDYPTIQQGINAAVNGDTVLVAPGTYVENINFNGKNITVTSESGAEVTIIDGNQADSVVKFISGEGTSAVLSGFSIYNGNAGSGLYGGGIRINTSSPTITQNIITNNKACFGPGIYTNSGAPIIERNTIKNNAQAGCSGGIGGGGICVVGGAAQIIENVITNNEMSSAGGGGITLWVAGTPTVKGNVIRGNSAYGDGGGIYVANYSEPLIIQNTIVGNKAGTGGGIYWSGQPGKLVNNTIADNDSPEGSGFYGSGGYDGQTELINNIITAKTGQIAIFCQSSSGFGPPTLKFNNIFSSSGLAYAGAYIDQTGINGNISAEPLFVAPSENNYHLLPDSPSIDAGDNSASNLPTTDLDGHDRIIDADGNGIAVVDMGAYEAPNVAVAPPYYNFGNITSGNSSSPQTFTISNRSSVNLLVSGISIAGTNSSEFSISSDNCSGQTLVPSGSCTVSVVFSPVSSGIKNASLIITSNNQHTPQINVALGGISDAVPPTGTISINSGSAATNSASVTLTLSCSDDVGCSQMKFSNDGTTYSAAESYATSKTWTLSSGDDSKTVHVKFMDAGGSWSTVAISGTIVLDTIRPVTTASPSGGSYSSAQNVTLTCSDGSGSGCEQIYYRTNVYTSYSVYSGPISISSYTTLQYYALDKASNYETTNTIGYTIDTSPAVTTASPPGSTYESMQNVTLSCNDGAESGCATTYYCLGSGCNPTTVYTGAISITSSTQLSFYSIDNVGLSEPVKTEAYTINSIYGSISGTVTDGINGIQGVWVSVCAQSAGPCNTTSTDANGNYTVSGLSTGNYKVYFQKSSSGYFSEYYNDKTSYSLADYVSVTAPNATTGVNAVLVMGGSISGNVSNGTIGLQSVSVSVYDAKDYSYTSAYTDSSGNFTITGLPTGVYKLKFSRSGYISEWYNDKTSITTANTVSVTAPSATTGINVVLSLGGSISGTVTNGSVGLSGVSVYVYDANGYSYISNTTTGSGGSYTVSGLPTGSYKIEFNSSGIYAGEWYNDKASWTEADLVSVTAPNTTTGINAVLATGGSISGTVTNGTTGLQNVSVYIYYGTNYSFITSTNTDANGNYTFSGLPTGSYKVIIGSTIANANNGYAAEWYNDGTSWANATMISVTAPAATTGINAVLAPGGSISGTVTDGTTGIPNVWVSAYDASSTESWMISGIALTDANGNYTFNGLPTGNYKLVFYGGSSGYVGEWYNDKKTMTAADPVSVTAPNATTGVNVVLAYGGSISGRVTDGVNGLQYVSVSVYDAEGIGVSGARTDANGNYTVKGVPAGNVKVLFRHDYGYYAAEWYNNKGDYYTSESVAVTVSNDTPNIDAVLTTGQSIITYPFMLNFAETSVGASSSSMALDVSNYGSSNLTIGSVSLTGSHASDFSIITNSCSGATLTSYPGCKIEITFNPTAGGVRNAAISIQSDDPDTPVLNVPLSGTGVLDITPPATTASPAGGLYYVVQGVALACNDGGGSGCDKIYYTTDGTTPTTNSTVYSGPISISANTTLKFFAKDLAGNSETVKAEIYTMDIDITAPSGTIAVNSDAANTNSISVNLTLSCTDANGCSQMRFSNDNSNWSTAETYVTTKAWTLSSGDGTKTVYVNFMDIYGNWTTGVISDTIVLDTTVPATTVSPSGGVYNTAKSLTLTCNDGAGSGCDKIYYTTDGTTPTISSTVYSTPISISASTTLKFLAKDLAGNSEGVKTESYTVLLTPPTTNVAPAGGAYASAQSVTLTCNDASGAACDKIYYTIDGTAPTTSSTVYSGPISISSTKTLKYFGKDAAGNTEAVKTETYTIDTTVPTGTISINSGAVYATSASVTLTLSCVDANGCSQMRFSNDNSTWSAAETYATTKGWALAGGDGTKAVYVKYRDTAGNWTTANISDAIILDINPAWATPSLISGTYTSPQSITLSCGDNLGSGCDKIYYTTDGTTPTTSSAYYSVPISISTTTTLKYFATDLAGNSDVVRSKVYTIAPAPSGATITPGLASPQIAGTSITFTAGATGGLGSYEYMFLINPSTSYTMVQGYSTSNTWTWNTASSAAGTYGIMVYVRNAGSHEPYEVFKAIQFTLSIPPASSANITPNLTSPRFAGTNIIFIASAAGGTGSYEYKFLLNQTGTYAQVQAYSTSNIWTWNTASYPAGNYGIMVYARNVGSYAPYEAYKAIQFTISGATITPGLTSPRPVGTNITFTAGTSVGTGSYEYKFLLNQTGTYSQVQAYSTSNTWTWNTGSYATGNYGVMVYVRSVGSLVPYEAYKAIQFSLTTPTVSTVTLTPNLASPRSVGTSITFTAGATGGSGNYEYKFLINQTGTYSQVQAYSTSNTWTWNTSSYAPGNYGIMVYVRNVGSYSPYEGYKAIQFTITLPTVSGATITPNLASPQFAGTNVVFTANATGGTGNYEYKFLLNQTGTYSQVQAYSTSNNWSWNTGSYPAGNYGVMVYVRNVGSTSPYEAYQFMQYTVK